MENVSNKTYLMRDKASSKDHIILICCANALGNLNIPLRAVYIYQESIAFKYL